MCRISVIIPVYNAELYLGEMLETLVSQNNVSHEVLLINDGSTDNSYSVYLQYAHKLPGKWIDCRRHEGAANARNEGLRYASGEYVIFLDADDLFEPELLAEMSSALDKTGADVAVTDFDSFRSAEGYHRNPYPLFEDDFLLANRGKLIRWTDIPEYYSHWINVPWNKMIRKSYLIEQGIQFQDLPSSNDVYFSHMVLIKGKVTIAYCGKVLLHYRTGGKGQVSSRRRPSDEILAYTKILKEIDMSEDLEKDRKAVREDYLYGLCKQLKTCPTDEYDAFYQWFREELLEKHDIWKASDLEERHSLLLLHMKEKSTGFKWYDTNFRFVERIWNHRDRLFDVLSLQKNGTEIATAMRGPKERALSAILKPMGYEIEEGMTGSIDILIVCGSQELTYVKNCAEKLSVTIKLIFPVYRLPITELIEYKG